MTVMTFERPGGAAAGLLLTCVLSGTPVLAQDSGSGSGSGGTSTSSSTTTQELTSAGMPLTRALAVGEGPVVDGDVLNDPMYADARVATGFVQSRPFEGRPASERTEVRIVYTEDTLYFGVVCYMEDPTSIIAADSRRDSDLTETDSFQIILDTYRDGQNGFIFGTNPAGVEYDGQVTKRRTGERTDWAEAAARATTVSSVARGEASTSTGTAPGRWSRR